MVWYNSRPNVTASKYDARFVARTPDMHGPSCSSLPVLGSLARTNNPVLFDSHFSPPDGRLPDADKGSRMKTIQHVRDIFYRVSFATSPIHVPSLTSCVRVRLTHALCPSLCIKMGFNDQEIVALCGAHAMGRCHTDRSGYWGPWTNAENTFSNEYFRLLLEERWSPKVTHNGKPWEGPDQFEDSSGQLMMLPSDVFLIADPEFKKWVEIYAKDETRFYKDFGTSCGVSALFDSVAIVFLISPMSPCFIVGFSRCFWKTLESWCSWCVGRQALVPILVICDCICRRKNVPGTVDDSCVEFK